MHVWTNVTVYHSMHGSGMEQECKDKCTVNNYHGSTKFLQLHSTAAVHLLLNFCKVCMEESSSRSSLVMTIDLLLVPSQATAVDMVES